MKRILPGIILLFNTVPLAAQHNFSFNPKKDITIGCSTSCTTLSTTIPNIYSSTTAYSVNQIDFAAYVNPGAQGISTNLIIDDRYSEVLNIGFPFSFYGTTFNQLIASTNGFLSFDTSKVKTLSHFGILNNSNTLSASAGNPQDLPSSLYDKALIMAPYHDLDPNNAVSSYQIKYSVTGSAPYRKWVLTYFNVPLYTKACSDINTNTQQIVLYETLGIVEILVYDKGICMSWNSGRAMIGMQDFNKRSAIMAPGRQASSQPWGSKGMNEGWRFVPVAGNALFKRTELYNLSGNFIAKGFARPGTNNLLNVTFPDVCPPDAGETYLVKSFYANPDAGAPEIIAIDTINISRGGVPMEVNELPASCSGGNSGNITVIKPAGDNYRYSLDGINWQQSNSFTVPQGNYTVRAKATGSNCVSSQMINVSQDIFTASIRKIVTPCPEPITGTIEVMPVHGKAPYLYSINRGPLQSSNIFKDLPAGNYTVFVTDAAGCNYSTEVTISAANLAAASVTNTICNKAGSGTITVTPNFGMAPHTYSINGGTFQSSNVFTGLTAGTYNIIVRDAGSCTAALDATITAETSISANIEIKKPKCYGSSDGELIVHPSTGISPYTFALGSGGFQKDSVFNDLTGGNYILHIKDSAGCVKDTVITVLQPDPIKGSTIIFPASTCTSEDGQITIKVNNGAAPYRFSIDNGMNFSAGNTFQNLKAGVYDVMVKDSNSCTLKTRDTLQAIDNKAIVKLGADTTICSGSSVALSAETYPRLTTFNWYPALGLNSSTIATPLATPADTITYILSAHSAVCKGTDTIKINVLHKPVVNAGIDTAICFNTSAVLRGYATNLSGSINYQWLPVAGIENPYSDSTIVRPRNSRWHTYRLQVTDNYGCNFKVHDDVKVFMNDPVPAYAGKDTVAAMGIPHQLFGSGGLKYTWTPANILNDPLSQNPVAHLQKDTRFDVVVQDAMGCTASSSVLVKVYKEPVYYLPNAFTPNEDGLNDVFCGVAPGMRTEYFRIYNRLGHLIFQSRDIAHGWNGKYSGTKVESGVYVWVIRAEDRSGKKIDLKGTVTLIR